MIDETPVGARSGRDAASAPRVTQSRPGGAPATAQPADGRLRWLLRRGMKELDVLLERYHAQRFGDAPPAEKGEFLRLVTLAEDPDIWAWVMGYDTPPAEYACIIDQLRIHR